MLKLCAVFGGVVLMLSGLAGCVVAPLEPVYVAPAKARHHHHYHHPRHGRHWRR